MWWIRLILICLFLSPTSIIHAQDTSSVTPYENPDLGIAFNMPTHWQVRADDVRLTAGSESDVARLEVGQTPQNLILLVRMGNYSDLGLENVTQLAQRIQELVLPGAVATEPIEVAYGNANGYQIEFTVDNSALTTRVALLLSTDGRVAIVRGIAPQALWLAASQQLTEIMQSIQFTLPLNMSSPLDNVPDSDGGVLWHFQTAQIREQSEITLGGITYDPYNVVYMAAGSRGFMALDQETGDFLNFLGPIFADDNLTDVAISPDLRLYFANATTNQGRHIMIIDRVGNLQQTWGIAGDEPGQFAPGMPRTIAVSQSGDVWTASEGHTTAPYNRLYRYDQDGNFIAMVDLSTIHPDLHNVRLDMDLDADRIYVVGEGGGINVLTWRGDRIATGIAADFLTTAVPTDISVSTGGRLVVATANEGFLLMNAAGVVLDRFGFPYDTERGSAFQPGEYAHPGGVTAGPDGITMYFAETHPDTGFAQAQAFTFSGEGNLTLSARTPAITESQGASEELADGGDIVYGDIVIGILNNASNRNDYVFSAQMGDQVVITMRDISVEQNLDTYLILFDANYNRLAENDDVGVTATDLQETDSIIRFTFSASGNYVIRAARFGGQGQYELSLELQ